MSRASQAAEWKPVREVRSAARNASPEKLRGPLREAGWVALFAAIAVAGTWPLAAAGTWPMAVEGTWPVAVEGTWPVAVEGEWVGSLRGDTFVNLWNAWWMGTALFERQVSPWWTDLLHAPDGISLARHVLSPLNALAAAGLSRPLGLPAAFNAVVVAHFALAGWGAFLLARRVSGTVAGAVLAGIVYAFGPYHYAYLAQVNVASTGWLPLALLLLLRVHRRGDAAATAGVAVVAAALVASSQYYLVYAAVLGLWVWACGRWVDPEVSWGAATRRLAVAGALAGLAVVLVAWPVVRAALAGLAEPGATSGFDQIQMDRTNDLLGYNWLGPPERYRISWPTMLGWSTLGIVVVGHRAVLRQRFWLLLALLFTVLSLGPSLRVAGVDTGIPLPYVLFDAPVLSMLRKPDRCFVVVQLVAAVLLAVAWRDLAQRLANPAARAAWLGCAALLAFELTAAPLEIFPLPRAPWLEALREDPTVRTVVHLPTVPGTFVDARWNWAQTVHGKRMPQGYTANLALTPELQRRGEDLRRAQRALGTGDAGPLVTLMAEREIDLAILHKTVMQPRPPGPGDGSAVWLPFRLARGELMRSRQLGPLVEAPAPALGIARKQKALAAALGPPVHEDDTLVVFRRRWALPGYGSAAPSSPRM